MKLTAPVWRTYERWDFQRIGERLFDGGIRAAKRPMVVLRRSLAG